ncbi:MAG: Uma2 family endonuclease [Okeania sp. SIO3C4]|nr:Uma2 family endonuclease [Okeania sp. SIO3C4]
MDKFVLYLPESIQFTEDQLLALCEQNSHLRIEVDTEQNLTIMSPASSKTGHSNAYITSRFFIWDDENPLGMVFDSSAGFRLPDGSIKSPDTSFIEQSRWDTLTEEQQEGFAEICPDFVLELRSPSDNKNDLLSKMNSYMENGCRLAWLIDPMEKEVRIYRPSSDTEIIELTQETILKGEDVLLGFELRLERLLSK